MRWLTPTALALVLSLASTEAGASSGEIGVLFTTARAPAEKDDVAWLPARLADLVAQKLGLLGAPIRDRRFLGAAPPSAPADAGLAALLVGRVRPEAVSDPTSKIAVEVELSIAGAKREKKKWTRKAEEIDRLAADIALFTAGVLGVSVANDARPLLEAAAYPFSVHRYLGLARSHLDADRWRKAALMYDRAAQLMKVGAVPEAIAGRLLAEGELIGRGEGEYGAHADLALSAAERAEVALRRGDEQGGLRALEAYLRYTPDRAIRWSVEAALGGGSQVIARGGRWTVQGGQGRFRRWTIEPRTGAVIAREPGLEGLVDLASGQPLLLEDRSLSRLDARGRSRWKVSLPHKPRSVAPDAVEQTSGLLAVIGDRSVSWVEVSFGTIAQVASDVTPLASGAAGVLVMLPGSSAEDSTREIALLRPGKKTPAWTALVPPPLSAVMTVDRVLLLAKEAVHILRAYDGKPSTKPIAVSAEARLLGADGRYGAAADQGAVLILDLLAGERTAIARGPGNPAGYYTAANGVAILYSTGDLLFYDRDGGVLDRARVPGEPLYLIRGSPMSPGPVAVTTRGLFAFGEVSADPGRMRDVDAMLRLAGLFARIGEPQAALRWTEEVARVSAGRVERAEQLRAEILQKRSDPASQAAARWATERAQIAQDPTKPLPPFRLIK